MDEEKNGNEPQLAVEASFFAALPEWQHEPFVSLQFAPEHQHACAHLAPLSENIQQRASDFLLVHVVSQAPSSSVLLHFPATCEPFLDDSEACVFFVHFEQLPILALEHLLHASLLLTAFVAVDHGVILFHSVD